MAHRANRGDVRRDEVVAPAARFQLAGRVEHQANGGVLHGAVEQCLGGTRAGAWLSDARDPFVV